MASVMYLIGRGSGCPMNNTFRKGFYLNDPEDMQTALLNLRNDKWNFQDHENDLPGHAYENADAFLHGSCWLFSLVLHEKTNMDALELRGADNRLIHAFCIFPFGDATAFVDVRGITTDFDEFIFPFFIYPNEKVKFVPQNTAHDYESMTIDEKIGYEFALAVYSKNSTYYSPG